MNPIQNTTLTLAAVLALTTGTAAAQDETEPIAEPGAVPVPQTTPDDPADTTAVPPDPAADPATPTSAFDLETTANFQLDQTFAEAQRHYTAGQLAEAASLLLHAAAATEALADPARQDVAEAVASLRVLAYDIASHHTPPPAAFASAAAATHQALATEQVLRARGALADRRNFSAGRSLQLATFHLRQAIHWGGHQPNPDGLATLAAADSTGTALTFPDAPGSPPPPNPAVVNASIDRLAAMIAATGRTLYKDRAEVGIDERVTEAARRAIDGIEKGTRKAAEKLGDRLQRWGRKLSPDP